MKKEPVVLVNGYEVQDILSEYAEEIGNELLYEIVVRMKTNCKVYEQPKQGEWIVHKDKIGLSVECPFCHKEMAGDDLNYCCKCGARMKGGDEK